MQFSLMGVKPEHQSQISKIVKGGLHCLVQEQSIHYIYIYIYIILLLFFKKKTGTSYEMTSAIHFLFQKKEKSLPF